MNTYSYKAKIGFYSVFPFFDSKSKAIANMHVILQNKICKYSTKFKNNNYSTKNNDEYNNMQA